jgi:hypothetical protein
VSNIVLSVNVKSNFLTCLLFFVCELGDGPPISKKQKHSNDKKESKESNEKDEGAGASADGGGAGAGGAGGPAVLVAVQCIQDMRDIGGESMLPPSDFDPEVRKQGT